MRGSAGSKAISRKGLAACMACMALLLGLVGLLLRPAPAQAVTNYDVWVGGVQVTSDNMNNVLGDGTVTFKAPQSSEVPGTLTLKNAHIVPDDVWRGGNPTYKVGILLGPDANCSITLDGASTIASASNPARFGILSEGYLQIHRTHVDDSLDIYAGVDDSIITSRGIESTANMVIDAGLFLNIHCYGRYCNGIEAWSSYGVNNSGYLTIDMDDDYMLSGTTNGVFISAPDGSFVISGIGKATIDGANYGVRADNVNVGGYQTSSSAELTVSSYYILWPYSSSLLRTNLGYSNLSDGYAEASYNLDGSDPVKYDVADQLQYEYLHVFSNTTYNIWFGNIQVCDGNRTDILGDGTAWYEPGAGPNPDTLYLKECDFYAENTDWSSGPGAYEVNSGNYAGLYIDQPLRIVISGENWIQNYKDQADGVVGIWTTDNLEIVGEDPDDDFLSIYTTDTDLDNPTLGTTCGLYCDGSGNPNAVITIKSCSVSAEGGNAGDNSYGLYCFGSLQVVESGDFYAGASGTRASSGVEGAIAAEVTGFVYVDETSSINCWGGEAPNAASVGLVIFGTGNVTLLGERNYFQGSDDATRSYGIYFPSDYDGEAFVLGPKGEFRAYGYDQAMTITPNFTPGFRPYVRYGQDGWTTTAYELNPSPSVYTSNEFVSIVPKPVAFDRIFGSDRYSTAANIVMTGFRQQNGTVVLATGESFPDALCASALAGKEDAPIIMTKSKSLSESAMWLFNMLHPSHIYVVGGTGAVSDEVVSKACEIAGIPYDSAHVTRCYGANRYATCLDVYQTGGLGGDTCIIATGGNFADALSISPYAYATETPIFLADPKTLKLDAATEAAIKGQFDNVIIVGGTGVVSDAVVTQVGATSKVRLAGNSRYDTSMEIAKWEMHLKSGFEVEFQPSMVLGVSNVAVATGTNYPDALAGGALCGKFESVLLLVSESNYANQVKLVKDNADDVGYGFIFGGTGAVSDKVKSRFDNALN